MSDHGIRGAPFVESQLGVRMQVVAQGYDALVQVGEVCHRNDDVITARSQSRRYAATTRLGRFERLQRPMDRPIENRLDRHDGRLAALDLFC